MKILGFRNDIDDILEISDFFVFPSKREGLSVAIMEAMYHQLPIVCSNIRGNNDLLKDYKRAWIVNGHHLNDYTKAIKQVIEQINENNLHPIDTSCLEPFKLENTLNEHIQIYKEVLIG